MTTAHADDIWSGWENWMESHKLQVIDIACEAAGTALGETRAELEKRIKTLELQLAETRGALDVLRAKGVPGALRVCGS
jgi:hypothetical protein